MSAQHFSTASRLPQSRRLRLCTFTSSELYYLSASRLPQSRRLRLGRQIVVGFAAAPPQDCRSRGDCGRLARGQVLGWRCRLKIAAVAATAALGLLEGGRVTGPPQDCRSRGDCGKWRTLHWSDQPHRLKIAAVAATAAAARWGHHALPICRLKIAAVAATAASTNNGVGSDYHRLKIAAVAATAAG